MRARGHILRTGTQLVRCATSLLFALFLESLTLEILAHGSEVAAPFPVAGNRDEEEHADKSPDDRSDE